MSASSLRVPIDRWQGAAGSLEDDTVAVEDALEIRVDGKSISITMRTPGNDAELAAGFLFAESIIQSAGQIRRAFCSPDENANVIHVELSPDSALKVPEPQRAFMMTSACGVCGKESLEALTANKCPIIPADELRLDCEIIHSLPDRLRRGQTVFDSTGGLHAAALFHASGELVALREDVGRHNAVDKLIGYALLNGLTPLRDSVMLVSGRASFELVQKALVAGVPVLAAVGAPSSLAVSTARSCGLTLIGFLRSNRFNVYSGNERLLASRTEVT